MARGRRQQQIPGTEPATIPEIDEAALEYVAARDKRIAASGVEKTKYAALVEVMKKHNTKHYKFDTDDGTKLAVDEVVTEVKVKVKKVKDDDDETTSGEGEGENGGD